MELDEIENVLCEEEEGWGGEGEEMFIRTNLWNKGLISADRNNKATLPLTIPCSIQVVCKGSVLSNISNAIRRLTGSRFRHPWTLPIMILDANESRLFLIC